jgi:glycosyltransferase involved in cell wall biosynthesis
MALYPRVSIVTPSYNQGRFLGETIDSVLAQDYPNLEHIVVDGMSTDETPAVLARYPHLRVIREPDRGQADAVNKGFRAATGDVLAFLNSDDTYLPGALHRVAREIAPGRGRHVVTGRCLYTDEDGVPTGREHPCAFEGHARVLAVWKVHCLPQPSTFWTAEAWRRCGPLDPQEHLVPDFDLMCRLSRRYRFRVVDQVLVTYRLHAHSKSCANRAEDIYARAVQVSRQYWGSPLRPLHWRLRWSLAHHRGEGRRERLRRAARLLRAGYEARADGRRREVLTNLVRASLLAPGVALRRFLRPDPDAVAEHPSPLTRAYRGFTGLHADGWVGPTYATTFRVGPGDRSLRLEGRPLVRGLPRPLDIILSIDGRTVGRQCLPEHRPFSLTVPVGHLGAGEHGLVVTSGPYVVPRGCLGIEDDRPLGFRLTRLAVTADEAEEAGARRGVA